MRSQLSLALLAATGTSSAFRLTSRQEPPSFDWGAIATTTDLKNLTACFDTFKCGRLNVPLDYTRKDGPNAIIPVVVFPATDKANYKGVLLLNPGGPGGSGTQAILGLGATLSQVAGPGYDIVGFDPRGTGASIPSAKCFGTEEWAKFQQSEHFVLENKEDIAIARARDELIAQKCASVLGGNGKEEAKGTLEQWGGGRFMDTGSVANDMLSIVKAFGQDKLNYIGVSYGTVLGQYFAAMHPDNVGLMVIDGVADAENWRKADIVGDLQDGDKVFGKFIELCTKAGPAACSIAGRSANQTSRNVDKILNSLKTNPIPVLSPPAGPTVVTYDAVRAFLRTQMYEPLSGFAALADVLGAIQSNNQTSLSNFGVPLPDTGLPSWYFPDQALHAISCTDYPDLSKTSLDASMRILKDATKSSKWLGPIMARVKLECVPWKMRAKAPFTGSLSAKKLSGKLLVVSNRWDPVTPIADAKRVQSRFGDSALLIQETMGHTALLSLGSCAAQNLGAFFQAGVLPKTGTVCQPDVLPLVGPVNPAPTQPGQQCSKSS